MRRTIRTTPIVALTAAALGAAGCFVSIDESLMDQQQQPTDDAATDVTTEMSAEGGDAAPDVSPPDANDSASDVVSEALPDAPVEASEGGDAHLDSSPDADAAVDVVTEASNDALPEASDDADVDASDDAEVEASDDAEVEASDDADIDVSTDAPDDVTTDGPPAPDGGLVVCSDDSWCEPVGCTWRKCVNGTCVDQGTVTEVTHSFDLPLGTVLACPHQYNRSCVAAVGPYLTLLSDAGLLVYNVRNPLSVRQETLPSNVAPGSKFVVRSGQRLWSVSTDTGNPSTVALSWIDLPADGVSPMPAFHVVTAFLGGALTGMYAGPNDTVYLQTTVGGKPAFARFGPGLPTYLEAFAATGADEPTSVASSLHRVMFQGISSNVPHLHAFSLQNNAATSASSNSGTVDITALPTSSTSRGFFASSRKGSVAWLIGTYDGSAWKDVHAFWLADSTTSKVQPSSFAIESFAVGITGSPLGPLAFIDETTVAAAVIAGGSSLAPSLDIVRRTGAQAPELVKRIAMPGTDLAGISVAADNGYAYVVRDGKVQIYAPSCKP